MNLLEETIHDIERSGHNPNDIVFIGSPKSGHSCTWSEFESLADREYDDGFGAQQVASDLVILFSDGTNMWRHEYDGSEYWNYSSPITIPSELKPIRSLFVRGIGWEDLEEIHSEEDE